MRHRKSRATTPTSTLHQPLSRSMNVLSICAGYGGIDLGLRLAVPAARTVCWVEREAAACEILVRRMSEGWLDPAPIWSDATTFDGKPWNGVVDCIAAGIPCQPWSTAGKRKGFEDERHLGEHLVRTVGEVGPGLVFVENVSGFVRLGPPTFSGDWPTSGTMRSGACFPLPESAPLIDGSESSCWPTATAGDSKGSGSAAYSTESDDKSETPEIRPGHSPPPSHQALLPGSGSESSPAPGLQWMTPRVANIKGSKKRRASWENHSLDSQAREVWAENLKARLNPDFVEWLMGLPHGWTDSECSETAWSHWLQLMRSALSPHESTHKP
jgi:hypothetical protein